MGDSREGFLDGDGCSGRNEGEGEGEGEGRDEDERFLSAMETNIRSSIWWGLVNIGARLPGTKKTREGAWGIQCYSILALRRGRCPATTTSLRPSRSPLTVCIGVLFTACHSSIGDWRTGSAGQSNKVHNCGSRRAKTGRSP